MRWRFDRDMRAWLAVLLAGVALGCGGGGRTAHDSAADREEAGGAVAGGMDATGEAGAGGEDATAEHEPTDAPAEPRGDLADAVTIGDVASDGPSRDGEAADTSPDAACAAGCAPENNNAFCQQGEAQWLCHGSGAGEQVLVAGCRMAFTDAIRFCCPPSFVPRC